MNEFSRLQAVTFTSKVVVSEKQVLDKDVETTVYIIIGSDMSYYHLIATNVMTVGV